MLLSLEGILDQVTVFLVLFANSMCLMNGEKTYMVSMEGFGKPKNKVFSLLKFKKGTRKEPNYVTILNEHDEEELVPLDN